MSSVRRCSLIVAAAALAVAAPLSAQWKPVTGAGPMLGHESSVTVFGADFVPFGETTRPGTEAPAPTFVVPPLPGVERTSTDVALMIVGGAALILGSVIGDDAGAMMMVGGGVVGLVGLYQYLT
ncbi:MAG: hypothetical protein AB7T31_03930 [Gemmatimonadales bacterium]